MCLSKCNVHRYKKARNAIHALRALREAAQRERSAHNIEAGGCTSVAFRA
jgi:hypothetical protein